MRWDDPQVRELIDLALREDIGAGDVTTDACVSADAVADGYFLPKQPLTLAGTPLLEMLYEREQVRILHGDGQSIRSGQVFARVRGSARRLLTLERTALNIVQRACGIATLASRYVAEIEGTGCLLLDTRKTQPGMRLIDKLAVRAGGGTNHRSGLFDAILRGPFKRPWPDVPEPGFRSRSRCVTWTSSSKLWVAVCATCYWTTSLPAK